MVNPPLILAHPAQCTGGIEVERTVKIIYDTIQPGIIRSIFSRRSQCPWAIFHP
jgi:hypothetical protein